METKPFDLQSPIKIASEYGGNKQKIAEASKMGIVDPTAALLAGMFIDRMRSAQQAEMTPQQTVAQQVFSPQPPPPPPGAMPQGGPPRGGPPRGGPPMPMGGAPMPPPPPPQGGPPMGMASGGLMSIPVPDAMFDEPDNGGYANGGIVAFAAGDSVSGLRAKWEKIIRDPRASKADKEAVFSQLKQAQQETYSTPSLISEVPNVFNALRKDTSTPLNVVPGSYPGAPNSAPVFAPRAAPGNTPGLLNQVNTKLTPQEIASSGYVPPSAAAPVTARPTAPRMGVPTAPVAPVAPTATTATGDGLDDEYNKMLKGNYADRTAAITDIKTLMGADKARPELDALREANKKALSPEEQKKDREQDMWMTLAQIGAGMAATKSPSFMQAAGESIQAALPGMIADRKARKAEVKDALKEQAALEGMDRQEAREYAKMGLDEYNRGSDILMKAKELARQGKIEEAKLVLEQYKAENERRYQMGSLDAQRAALNKPSAGAEEYARYVQNPTQFKAFSEAQYAGRGAAANPFGDRMGTGGSGVVNYGSLK